MRITLVVRILLAVGVSTTIVACIRMNDVQNQESIQGSWIANRIPEVQGVSLEEYAQKTNLLLSDTNSYTIFSFFGEGRAKYYPYIQKDGKYIPGNLLEGHWLVRDNILYVSRGEMPLTPMCEFEVKGDKLRLLQSKKMRITYFASLIEECNKRIADETNQQAFLEYASLLTYATNMKRATESIGSDFTLSRTYMLKNGEPTEINEEHDIALIAPTNKIHRFKFYK